MRVQNVSNRANQFRIIPGLYESFSKAYISKRKKKRGWREIRERKGVSGEF